MISPIGSFLTMFDTPLQAAILNGSHALMVWVAPIASLVAILYYLLQGIRWANGDTGVARNFVPQLMRVVFLLCFCANAVWFNKWIIGLLYIGLPQAMTSALAGSMGANTTNVSAGVSAAAAAFDQIWDLLMVVVGTVWAHSGYTEWAVWLAAALTAIGGGLALVGAAIVYFLSRLLLGIVVILGPAIIACGLLETTRPVVDRALGKSLSLILLQVSAIIVLQILLTGDQQFMRSIITASAASGPPVTPGMVQNYYANGGNLAPATAIELSNLAAILVWFFAGAFAMYALPAIAYSLGTGVTTSALPALIGAAAAARYLGGGGPPGGGGGGGGGGPPGNWDVGIGKTYDVSLRRDPIPAGGRPRAVAGPRALPPPPPPSLASSTRS